MLLSKTGSEAPRVHPGSLRHEKGGRKVNLLRKISETKGGREGKEERGEKRREREKKK